eukprot:gene34124-biopygen14436
MVRSGQEDFNNNVLERETEFLEPHLDVSRNFDERQEEPDPINAYPLAANTQHHPEQRYLHALAGSETSILRATSTPSARMWSVLGQLRPPCALEGPLREMEARARANGALELTAPGNAPVAVYPPDQLVRDIVQQATTMGLLANACTVHLPTNDSDEEPHGSMDLAGRNAWGNLPFPDSVDILRYKYRRENGTSGTSIVPCRQSNPRTGTAALTARQDMWRLSPAVFAIDSSLASGCFGGVDVCGCGDLHPAGEGLPGREQAGTPVLEEAAVEAECTPLPVASAPRGRGCGKWRLWAPESLRVPEEVPAFGRRGFGTCQPTRQKELSKAGFRLVALVRRSELTRSSSVAEPLLSRDDATWHLSALLPEDAVEGASSSMPWSVVLVRALMIVEGAAFVLLHTAAVEERQKVIAYGNATPHKQAGALCSGGLWGAGGVGQSVFGGMRPQTAEPPGSRAATARLPGAPAPQILADIQSLLGDQIRAETNIAKEERALRDDLDLLLDVLQMHSRRLADAVLASGTARFGANPLESLRAEPHKQTDANILAAVTGDPVSPWAAAFPGILVQDAAQPLGYKFPIHWDVGAATAVWRDVREQSIQRWKDVGYFVKSLRDFAVAQAPIAGAAGGPAGQLLQVGGVPVVGALAVAAAEAPDPAILLLQQQLAQQQADHAAALIAIQAQLAAQAASHAAALAAVPAAAAARVVDPAVCVLLDELSASAICTEKWSRESLDLLAETAHPAKMSLLIHLCPELEAEDPDTLVGPRATLELLQARALLKKTLTEWQNFVALADPAFVTPEFHGLGGGHATMCAGPRAMPAAGGATTALAMVPKTPTKPELFRQRESDIEARGDPVSDEAAQFTGGGSLLTRLAPAMRSGGLHAKSRLHLKTKCKSIEERGQAFLHIAIDCPSKEQGAVVFPCLVLTACFAV